MSNVILRASESENIHSKLWQRATTANGAAEQSAPSESSIILICHSQPSSRMPSILKAHPTLGVAAAQLRAAPSNACAQCAAGNGDPCSCCPLSTSFYTLQWPIQPDENITKLKHNAWAAGYWGSLLSLLPTELLLTTSGKNILRVTEKISPKDIWVQSWGNRFLEYYGPSM